MLVSANWLCAEAALERRLTFSVVRLYTALVDFGIPR